MGATDPPLRGELRYSPRVFGHSPKPEFAARIPSTPHLGMSGSSTYHFNRIGVLGCKLAKYGTAGAELLPFLLPNPELGVGSPSVRRAWVGARGCGTRSRSVANERRTP